MKYILVIQHEDLHYFMYLPVGPLTITITDINTANPEHKVLNITPQCVMKINHRGVVISGTIMTIEAAQVPMQPMRIRILMNKRIRLERLRCQGVI